MPTLSNLNSISEYSREILEAWQTGQAKEHGYRPALERLMSSFHNCIAVNDPKRSAHGNPDFIFIERSNKNVILGYAEAKDIDISLDKSEKTDQMRRYAGYDNLFLTNYLEFRFFRNGVKYQTIVAGSLENGQLKMDQGALEMLFGELQAFLEQPPEKIKSGKRLSEIMGAKARRVRDNVQLYFEHADKRDDQNQELEKIYKMMRTLLVHDLSTAKFADMYAQTLVYGLFVARFNDTSSEHFSRSEARDLVPASNPFLREFFDHIVGPHFDPRLRYIVDELCEVFSVSDVRDIVHKHLRLTDITKEDKDPVIHFYEDFLREYDPDERKKMGAYYTPIPVVRFIVNQVDQALKRDFGLSKGLTDTSKKVVEIDRGQVLQVRNAKTGRLEKTTKERIEFHRVQILDPAVGTATFLNEIIKYIYQGFEGQAGLWPSYAATELLPRLYGFELMMAPYTIAHLKLGMTLQETGLTDFRRRLGVYLTNTLEEGIKGQRDLFTLFGLAEVVTQEANEAAKIKHDKPIMVIIGNPPYAGESSNKTEYAAKLVAKYKFEPGGTQKLAERNPKWINDDYVKFIAFAEEMIERNGEGIVAMITNHGYLDNPTFRGMRGRLASTFDSIHILDLHGNTKKKESAPDGGKDENVFDIQQGVAIIIAVKTSAKRKREIGKVYHADLFGTRKFKFDQLDAGDTPWKELTLDPRMYYFADTDNEGKDEYDKGVKLDELFIMSSVGILTARDQMAVQNSVQQVEAVVEDFRSVDAETLRTRYKLGKDVQDWTVASAKQDVINNDGQVVKVAYRPFDSKYTYYTGNSRGFLCRPRVNVMKHYMSRDNVGLLFSRMTKGRPFAHAFVTENISEVIFLSPLTGTNAFNAPLYLYHDDGSRTPNFKPNELSKLTKNLQEGWAEKDILDYIYGVLYTPSYRSKYQEFLKSDFPRIPIPSTDAQFKAIMELGRKLRSLHLMKADLPIITSYPVAGTDSIDKINFRPSEDDPSVGDVYINDTQYFGSVPSSAWGFLIGGYEPAQKWLKDRKGAQLSANEIEYYQQVVAVLAQTSAIMNKLDQVGTTVK